MNYPREASARRSTISASITKSVFWLGGFLAGAFLWLEPAPGLAIHPAPPSGAGDSFVLADGLKEKPVARPVPYATPNPRFYICSSSTPPGGGVHGMSGWHAARAALRGTLF